MAESVRVICRCRPLNRREIDLNSKVSSGESWKDKRIWRFYFKIWKFNRSFKPNFVLHQKVTTTNESVRFFLMSFPQPPTCVFMNEKLFNFVDKIKF